MTKSIFTQSRSWPLIKRAATSLASAYVIYKGIACLRQRRRELAERRGRDAQLDRTLEESFPASDPYSSIPNPGAAPTSV